MTIAKLPTSPILPNSIDGDGSTFVKSLKAVEQKVAQTINRILDEGVGEGTQIFTGTSVPTDATGSNDDLYVLISTGDTNNGNVYKKVSGSWALQGNIKGGNGTNGTNGANGTSVHVETGVWTGTTNSSIYYGNQFYTDASTVTFTESFTTPCVTATVMAPDGSSTQGQGCIIRNVGSTGFQIAGMSPENGATVYVRWIAIERSSSTSSGTGTTIYVQTSEPSNPSDGAIWIDTDA